LTTPKIIDPLYGTIDMGVNARLRELYYSIYRRLLGTFEMDRADWLYQAGHLFRLFPGATHTRKAHAVGCWCVGCHALQDVRVAVGSNTISLMTWLDDAEHKVHLLEEFLAALLLHDVGHLPFSHAMEYAPELGLDHETIALGLNGDRLLLTLRR